MTVAMAILTAAVVAGVPSPASASRSGPGPAATQVEGLLRAAAPRPLAVAKPLGAALTRNAWDCPGGYACFFDGSDGTYRFWIAPNPGFFDLGEFDPHINDRLTSVSNGGAGLIHLYDWVDNWVYLGTIYPGQNVNLPPAINNRVDGILVLE
jgi:hypothetical protein